MNKTQHILFALVLSGAFPVPGADGLEREFHTPPDAARPGVYWYFLDGNQDREAMMADLRAMKEVGIGSFVFLEVDLGVPRGPVPFMSEAWQENVSDAFVEAGRLGMEVILGTGPGWSGSGGSWVPVEDSMQHLVGGSVRVSGPGVLDQILPVPPPHAPNHFAGMNATHAAQRDAWFEDVAVLAYPTPPDGPATIDQFDIKTLKDIPPYSIRRTTQRFVMPRADYPEPAAGQVIDDAKVIDLTPMLQAGGRLRWRIPEGDWTVMRFVARSTGQTTRPAPRTGHGFENDKFDAATFRRHWDRYHQVLLDKIVAKGGPLQPGKGLTTIHLDSWEMSSQNWTADFRREFRERRGYDPQPFYPAWMGLVVGGREKTERFLWDMRKTAQELVLEEYAGEIKRIAHEHGLLYSNEPYDMNPAGDLDLGSVADIPMCEFWNDHVDTQYSCLEAVSIAHTMGPQVVRAEAFTGQPPFDKHPANMKNQTDWALAIGINSFMFHTFQHQPLGPDAKPGMTFGPYGIHWNRNQTFWDLLPAYHRYLARCSHLLRQGEAVADILYLTPDGAPHIFEPPADAMEGPATMRDKKGHAFDAVSPRILGMRATVDDGHIAFPDGSRYRVLVLPDVPTMAPETLARIDDLVRLGAIVIGHPPVKSPSLMDYPNCDAEVGGRVALLWGGTEPPDEVTRIPRGHGAIYWGGELRPAQGIFPSYAATAAVLAGLGVPEDFHSPSGKLRHIHRRTTDRDIYFVANRTAERVVTEGVFRIDGLRPELWDPVTGETRALHDYATADGTTTLPLSFEPHQSFFVVFPHDTAGSAPPDPMTPNFPSFREIAVLDGAWDVSFDPALGGPEQVTFDSLTDWTRHPKPGIRYYSGLATYRKTFDLPGLDPAAEGGIRLDLGMVHNLCRVRLNGEDLGIVWTAPWRIDPGPALREKGNQLEIDVVNTWANRLIGDQQPGNKDTRQLSWPSGLLGGRSYPAGRHTFVWRKYHNAASPLLPAGLVGPVSLEVAASSPATD